MPVTVTDVTVIDDTTAAWTFSETPILDGGFEFGPFGIDHGGDPASPNFLISQVGNVLTFNYEPGTVAGATWNLPTMPGGITFAGGDLVIPQDGVTS